jgi:methylated-DNA-[protein]-cysteine S-methyltransferase
VVPAVKQLRDIVYMHAFPSPIGQLHTVVDRGGRVLYLGFRSPEKRLSEFELEENKYACGEIEYQLAEYFMGSLREFSVELRLDGTGFQKAVWSRLLKIEYGATMSYGEVAQKIGRRDSARAVGNAVAANQILILIPCHRVVPAGGGIGCYARRSLDIDAGKRIKSQLLELESKQVMLNMSMSEQQEGGPQDVTSS